MSKLLNSYIAFFEQISPQRLTEIDQLFAKDAVFRDPFNEAHGPRQIRAVFQHMFENCESPRFQVSEAIEHGDVAYLRWDFTFGADSNRTRIEGVSRICFSSEGQILEHVDYWDPARQLYERIPLFGLLLGKIRQRLSATKKP
jgi:ketosteroid isomerase-like protein